jgi:hypothetical protein
MDGMAERVNSYDPDARRPDPGSRWLWEPTKPNAYEPVSVIDVSWNDEEWWVKTGGPSGEHLNDLSRFWEAVVPETPEARQKAEARVAEASMLAAIRTSRSTQSGHHHS